VAASDVLLTCCTRRSALLMSASSDSQCRLAAMFKTAHLGLPMRIPRFLLSLLQCWGSSARGSLQPAAGDLGRACRRGRSPSTSRSTSASLPLTALRQDFACLSRARPACAASNAFTCNYLKRLHGGLITILHRTHAATCPDASQSSTCRHCRDVAMPPANCKRERGPFISLLQVIPGPVFEQDTLDVVTAPGCQDHGDAD